MPWAVEWIVISIIAVITMITRMTPESTILDAQAMRDHTGLGTGDISFGEAARRPLDAATRFATHSRSLSWRF